MKYGDFLLENKKNEFYKFVLNDIRINIDDIILEFKKFNINCWHSYNNKNSSTFHYEKSSNMDEENLYKIKISFFERLPYFKELKYYKDDKRIVVSFFDIGEPLKFKFMRW